VLLGVFAVSDYTLHESGLLAVTVMGIWIANAGLPSYTELRRFKEHATVLLVSGVFILLAANMNRETLMMLDWRAFAFVVVVIVLVRPATVLLSLMGAKTPWPERLLVAFTGPRGVVLVAVAGLFGDRLAQIGIEGAERIAPLAFALVAASVVLHGFTLRPVARLLGLAGGETPGVILVGGSRFSASLGDVLRRQDVPVIVFDHNRTRLRSVREEGLPIFIGDILSEAAEHGVELMAYDTVIALTDNEAYNTLVATDLGPEFGREQVFQLQRAKQDKERHALPASLGGRVFADGLSFNDLSRRMTEGWRVRATPLTEEYTYEQWRADNPEAVMLGHIGDNGFHIRSEEQKPRAKAGHKIVALAPKREDKAEASETGAAPTPAEA